MVVLIDNYDSFTYNLVQRLGEIDASVDFRVFRNDKIELEEIETLEPSHLIISPGPCTPNEAGVSVACVEKFHGKLPILGVCLGHQSIGQATGGTIAPAKNLMHGKTDEIHHDGKGVFAGLPNPMIATRYHSLVIQRDTLADDFAITAWTDPSTSDGEIMGIAHKDHPTFGVQFHPESFLTVDGITLLENFLKL